MDASALLRSGPVDQSEPRLPVDPLDGFSGCGIQASPHAQQKTKAEAVVLCRSFSRRQTGAVPSLLRALHLKQFRVLRLKKLGETDEGTFHLGPQR